MIVHAAQVLSDEGRLTLAISAYVVLGIIALAIVVSFVLCLISIISSARYTGGGKLLWAVLVFVFPIIGPVVWWVGGRKAIIRTEVP